MLFAEAYYCRLWQWRSWVRIILHKNTSTSSKNSNGPRLIYAQRSLSRLFYDRRCSLCTIWYLQIPQVFGLTGLRKQHRIRMRSGCSLFPTHQTACWVIKKVVKWICSYFRTSMVRSKYSIQCQVKMSALSSQVFKRNLRPMDCRLSGIEFWTKATVQLNLKDVHIRQCKPQK